MDRGASKGSKKDKADEGGKKGDESRGRGISAVEKLKREGEQEGEFCSISETVGTTGV